ncbi:hypothetical protein OUZ56_019446 [Daphnia magna]|uniref:Uncharacterized protein n=1 Tax=Daphnia magna TaxID=35525 RepID=A0ABQ9ZBL5_9CRUS|nr:hypothetical protein OUZ56_019446 [Daphnia magna]
MSENVKTPQGGDYSILRSRLELIILIYRLPCGRNHFDIPYHHLPVSNQMESITCRVIQSRKLSIDSVAEYLLFLQLYDQYKLDCVRKGKTPNGLPVFLSNLKDAQRVTEHSSVSADVAVSGLVNTDSPFKSSESCNSGVVSRQKMIAKRFNTSNTFKMHIYLMPHIGWLGTRASKQEKSNLADIYVSQRVVDFNVENTEEENYDAILKVYRDISLVSFVAQRADGNAKTLHFLPTLKSAELRKVLT